MNSDFGITKKVLDTICDTIEKQELFKEKDSILVALSGGADSVCLLSVLFKLKEKYKIKIGAVHLNHLIRGEEAERDEGFAKEFCKKLGVKLYSQKADVKKLAKEQNISEELAGRNARYELFEKVSKSEGYDYVATAHNKNDQAETLLMRIMRGTGIDGLAGIKYKRDNIIRPILDISRGEIEEYCKENNLEFCIDSTNSENEYTRNKVRNQLIPFIEEKFNPNIIDTLCNLADNTREDGEFLNGYAERLYRRINSPLPKRKPYIIDIESIKLIGDSIQNRIIAIAARETMGDGYKLSRCHILMIKDLLSKETGASCELPEGLKVSVKYGWLEFVNGNEAKTKSKKAFEYELLIEGELYLSQYDISFKIVEGDFKIQKGQMILNYDKMQDKKLVLRTRKFGDKIVVYKDGGSKKVKSFLIDSKVPKEERDEIPLLCADNEVIAIIGHRISENYKLNKDTKKGLVITCGKSDENR